MLETISLFDNGGPSARTSTARVLTLNLYDYSVVEPRRFVPPDDIVALSQGNAQRLPNGNYLVNWGQAGAVTEFRAGDAQPIFHAYLDSGALNSGAQSYRGFRFEWEGRASEDACHRRPAGC